MKRSDKDVLTAVLVLVVGLLFSAGATAAAYLKLPDIEGESMAADYEGDIEILSWSWGVSNFGSGIALGRRLGGACIQDMSLVKYIDKASIDLIMSVTTATQHDEATLTLVKNTGDASLAYLVIEMRDVSISSFSTGGSVGEDRMTENLTLKFSEALWTYTEQASDLSAGQEHQTVVSGSVGACR